MCKDANPGARSEQARPEMERPWAGYTGALGHDAGLMGSAKASADTSELTHIIHTRMAQLRHEIAALEHLTRSLSLDALRDRRTFDAIVALGKSYR